MKSFAFVFLPCVKCLLSLLALLAATELSADVRFRSPLEGSQLLGKTLLEIETNRTDVNRVDFFVDERLVGAARTAPYRAIHDFGSDGTTHRISALLYADRFKVVERTEITSLAIRTSDEMRVDLVEVPFQATSKRPLRMSDITINENGAKQTLLELRRSRAATHFIFVVDRSLSMSGGKFEAALRAIDSFRSRLREDDSSSIVTFNHRVDRIHRLSAKRSVREQLPSSAPSGGTSLRDALMAVKPAGRAVVMVISDGDDRNSASSESEALRHALRKDVTLYGFLLGSGNAEGMIRKVAAASGGRTFTSTSSSLDEQMLDVFAELNRRHVAVYQSSSNRDGWRPITIRAANAKIGSARKGYYAQ